VSHASAAWRPVETGSTSSGPGWWRRLWRAAFAPIDPLLSPLRPVRVGIKEVWREAKRIYLKQARYQIGLMVRNWWLERFTQAGRYVAIAAVPTVVAGVFQQQLVGSFAFSGFLAMFSLAAVFAYGRRPRARARRRAPVRCVQGAELATAIDLTNTARRALHEVGACEFRLPEGLQRAESPQYVARLAPGESHRFTYTLTAEHRGVYALNGPTVLCSAPFGLMNQRRFVSDPAHIMVSPAFEPIQRIDLPVGLKAQPGGLPLTSRVGHSMDFVGTREYRTGDRLQDLHPRSWARVGYPVVKQFQEEYLARVAVLVDTYLPGLLDEARLEANLSLAAAVSDYLARGDYVVDIFAAGDEVRHVRAGRATGYLESIFDMLAGVERSRDDLFPQIAPQFAEHLRQISSVFLLLTHWDEARRAYAERLRASGLHVRCVLVTDRITRRLRDVEDANLRVLTVEQIRNGIDHL